jgi:hypothetical protein
VTAVRGRMDYSFFTDLDVYKCTLNFLQTYFIKLYLFMEKSRCILLFILSIYEISRLFFLFNKKKI